MKFSGLLKVSHKEIEFSGSVDEVRNFCKKNLNRFECGNVESWELEKHWIFYRRLNKVVWEEIRYKKIDLTEYKNFDHDDRISNDKFVGRFK